MKYDLADRLYNQGEQMIELSKVLADQGRPLEQHEKEMVNMVIALDTNESTFMLRLSILEGNPTKAQGEIEHMIDLVKMVL